MKDDQWNFSRVCDHKSMLQNLTSSYLSKIIEPLGYLDFWPGTGISCKGIREIRTITQHHFVGCMNLLTIYYVSRIKANSGLVCIPGGYCQIDQPHNSKQTGHSHPNPS